MFTSLPASTLMPCDARVRLAHKLDLTAQLLGGDVVAEAVRGGVVGDRHVLVSALARRERHLLDRVAPVRGDRVTVKVALDVAELDQVGQAATAESGPSAAAASSPRSSRSSGSM